MSELAKPDWRTLPDQLRFLIDDAERYGIHDFDERAAIISGLSAAEQERLASLAERAQDESDAIFAWIDGHELHRASILLYWLMVFLEEAAPESPSTHAFTSPEHLQLVVDRLQSQRFVPNSADRVIEFLRLKPGLNTAGMVTATDDSGLELTIFVMDGTHLARKILVMLVFGIRGDVEQQYDAFKNMLTRSMPRPGEETVDDAGNRRSQWPLDNATLTLEVRRAGDDSGDQASLTMEIKLPDPS